MPINRQIDNIWIIGGGRFGKKAAEKLYQKNFNAKITVVEHDPHVCRQIKKYPLSVVCADGIDYLSENLKGPEASLLIVPAIPVHVAYEWIKRKLAHRFFFEESAVPDALAAVFPNPVKGTGSEYYVSNADFLCPEDCPEPDNICTYTGESRPRILHQYLKRIQYNNFISVVIQSRQLCPGVGGYSSDALFEALNEIVKAAAPVLLATACRCHGVVNAFGLHLRTNSSHPAPMERDGS